MDAFLTLPFQKLLEYSIQEEMSWFWSVLAASHRPGKSLDQEWEWKHISTHFTARRWVSAPFLHSYYVQVSVSAASMAFFFLYGLFLRKILLGWQDSLVGIGTFPKYDKLSSIPRIHTGEGENQVTHVSLWPPHVPSSTQVLIQTRPHTHTTGLKLSEGALCLRHL